MENRILIYNAIRTPDGTVLVSSSVHDYLTHTDANGLEYMVDGGKEYLRRNVHEDATYTELAVYADDPHERIREVYIWGTRGKNGDQPLVYKLLKDLSDDHIESIIRTQMFLQKWQIKIFKDELEYRDSGILDVAISCN